MISNADWMIGVALAVLAAVVFWMKNKDAQPLTGVNVPEREPVLQKIDPVDLKQITQSELSNYDGVKDPKVYIAIKGLVFDVTKSESYRPGASYSALAGKDASVALARMSMDAKDMVPFNQASLTQSELMALEDWVRFYKERYEQIGVISEGKKSD